jgi:hypothetical protein
VVLLKEWYPDYIRKAFPRKLSPPLPKKIPRKGSPPPLQAFKIRVPFQDILTALQKKSLYIGPHVSKQQGK